MASQADVDRIALALPDVAHDPDSGTFRTNGRLFAWPWQQRVDPRKRRVPNPDVLVVRVADEQDKQALIDLQPAVFFTEPHYDGYAAVLIRLPEIGVELLEKLIGDAHRLQTAKKPPRPRR